MNKPIQQRLNRFVIGTTRGRKMVKGIRLSGAQFDEYMSFLRMLGRYPNLQEWDVYFMGVPIYRHEWL